MELYKILIDLVKNPLVPRFYRELRNYYQYAGKINEVTAFDFLIEHKFNKKDDTINNSSDDTK